MFLLRSLTLLLLIYTVSSAPEIRCMECREMVYPWDCGLTTTCASHQYCHITQKVTPNGNIVYDTGCKGDNQCQQISGKRNMEDKDRELNLEKREDIVTCSECCRDRDFCNLDGCGETVVSPPQRGLYCFHCTHQAVEDGCREVIQCDIGQACDGIDAVYYPKRSLYPVDRQGRLKGLKLKAAQAMSGKLKEDLGKLTEGVFDWRHLVINDLEQDGVFIEHFGVNDFSSKLNSREATNSLRHRVREVTQGIDKCPYCCDSDFCNVNCLHGTK